MTTPSPSGTTSETDWHPLAWEIARHAELRPQSDGPPGNVEAWYTLHTLEAVRGCGPTSTEAMQSLARKLTHYAEVGAV